MSQTPPSPRDVIELTLYGEGVCSSDCGPGAVRLLEALSTAGYLVIERSLAQDALDHLEASNVGGFPDVVAARLRERLGDGGKP